MTVQDGSVIIKEDTVPLLHSFLAWRAWYKKHPGSMTIARDDKGTCLVCENRLELNTEEYGRVRCVCWLKDTEGFLEIETASYRSQYLKRYMDDYQPWGDKSSQDRIIEIKDLIADWMEWPKKWLLLTGMVGCGKSHILTSIATEFGSWCLYITAGDFEQFVFSAMQNHNLDEMMQIIKKAPLLVFDDLGADYGSDFIKSNLRKVIDFRYMLPTEYVTVIATNLRRFSNIKRERTLRSYDARIADRILDQHIGITIPFENIASWRSHADAYK